MIDQNPGVISIYYWGFARQRQHFGGSVIIQIQPWIDQEEMVQLQKVIQSTYVTEASMTKEFERLTKELTKSEHAISMTNGTAALYCCLKALGIGQGDEVLVPNLTFIATANSVLMAGATPVFVDIRSDNLAIDVELCAAAVTPRTKAIMPVHLYGQSCDMTAVLEFAKAYNLKVVEDAAQGVGVKFNGKHVGTFGELGILSYYGNKTITCGEGGIVLTNDQKLAQGVYRLKNHGRDVKGTFIHDHIGFNFSFTEMQAAIGVAQMGKLERIIKRKQEIYDVYHRELKTVESLRPFAIDQRTSPVHWFTSFRTEKAEQLGAQLKEMGIQTRRFFYPLNRQPCYQNLIPSARKKFPVSESAYEQGISLPSSYQLTDQEQAKVIDSIKRVLN